MKELYAYSSLLNVLTCVVIIVAVLVKNPRSVLVRLFCIFTGVMGCWAFLYFKWVTSTTIGDAEFFVRSVMIFTALMPPSFLQFVSELSERHLPRSLHLTNYLIGIAIACTVYTPYFASYGSKSFLIFPVWPVAGPVFFVQIIHFLVSFGMGFLMMYSVIRSGKGLLRTRIIAVFWGTLVAVATGATNYLPWFKIYVPPIFPPFLSLFVCFYAYAIVKHQLLDIEVIIKRTLVFAGLVGSVVAVVSLVAFVSQELLIRFVAVPRWLSTILAAVFIAATYGRLRTWLVNVTDRYLFQKRYDYKELLRKFSDEVAIGIRDLQQLGSMTVERLTQTVKLTSCSLWLLNQETRLYERLAAKGLTTQPLTLEEHEPVITFLRETHEPIGQDGALGTVRFPEPVRRRLSQLQARLCLPLLLHEDLIGLLCLGQKKSDEAFTPEDLAILHTLTSTLAIAISNAQLVEELTTTNAHLRAATERLLLQERQAAASQIAAGMAHEIKNPLTAIKTFAEFLPERYREPAFRETCFRIVPAEVNRIVALVKELCDFARPAPPQFQPVAVQPLIDDTLALLSNQRLAQRVEVRAEPDGAGLTVRADPQQLKQVLLNLCLNSLEAMAAGGRLTVATQAQGAWVRLRVTDTGCGMSPAQQPRIWDPFFTTKTRGMGLGLAIVKGIIERHGGRIHIESRAGEGTTVSLELPLAGADSLPRMS